MNKIVQNDLNALRTLQQGNHCAVLAVTLFQKLRKEVIRGDRQGQQDDTYVQRSSNPASLEMVLISGRPVDVSLNNISVALMLQVGHWGVRFVISNLILGSPERTISRKDFENELTKSESL